MRRIMRKILGSIVGWLYILTGVRVLRVWRCRKPGMLLALSGHDPEPQVLEYLLKWLHSKGFDFVSPDEIMAMRDGHAPLRSSIVWLTFDDGWAGFSDKILPLLERYNAKATIFVPTHESANGYLWSDKAKIAGGHEKVVELYSKPFQEREKMLASVSKCDVKRFLMSRDELIALSRHPLITLENHTWSHLSCFHRPVHEVVDEAEKAQKELFEWTGRRPLFMCYPYGHYANGCDETLKEIGLIGVHSDNGIGIIKEVGKYRNMFRDDMSKVETIGRALNAWPNQHIPDAQ